MSNEFPNFDFEVSDIIKPNNGILEEDWKVLRRLKIPDMFNQPSSSKVKRGVVLDVEATGLSLEKDDVIQLAMLPFEYDPENDRITNVCKKMSFEGLREPCTSISEEASLVTGITDQMVRGKTIDNCAVDNIVKDTDIIFAHNAQFDRIMVEKHWPCFSKKPWACTFRAVDWLREGYAAGKLDYIGAQFGWFYDGHSALADCEACLAILAQTLPKSGRPVLGVVRAAAQKIEYLICAFDAPFHKKNLLRDRGYRWRPAGLPNGRVWWTVCSDEKSEINWLNSNVYDTEQEIVPRKVTAFNRFSNRMWEF